MAGSWFSFSEPFNSGIDFNQRDSADVEAVLSSLSSLTVDSYKISFASITLTSNSDVAVSSIKIAYAQVNINDILSTTVTVIDKIKLIDISMSIQSNVATNAAKTAFAAVSPSASASISATSTKIAQSQSVLSSSASLNASATKTAFAAISASASASLTSAATRVTLAISALSSSVNLAVAGKISLATIQIVLQEVGAVVVQTPIVFAQNVASGIDASIYRTLVLLDGKPLTMHNRKLDMGVDQIFTETVNWNNRKTRYYKSSSRAGRRTFSMSWSWLPNSINYTVDGNSGRDFIKKVAEDPRHHVLKIINMDETGATPYSETSYNVLVKDYSETLIRRDIPNDVYFWDCSMSLEEV